MSTVCLPHCFTANVRYVRAPMLNYTNGNIYATAYDGPTTHCSLRQCTECIHKHICIHICKKHVWREISKGMCNCNNGIRKPCRTGENTLEYEVK